MRACRQTLVAAAVALGGCAHGASQRSNRTEMAQPPAPQQPEPQDAEPRALSPSPPRLPQSDPIPPPTPRCPSIGPGVKASAVVKREPPSRAQPASPAILDIELTVALPTNPTQLTFAQNHLTVYGGVLIKQTLQPANLTQAVVLIRPAWTVASEGSLRALFGVACEAAEGNLRVDMKFPSPLHEGDRVTIGGVDGY